MLTIFIPNRFDNSSMYRFIEKIITKDCTPVDTGINFSFKRLTFIMPSGVTVLSNIIEWLLKRGVEISISTPSKLTKPIEYLDDSGFFKHYLRKSLRQGSALRQTTAPLKLINHSASFSWLNYDFKFWMSSNLDLPEDCFDDIKTCLNEIFLNIKDHSGEEIGCVFMQYFPNKKEISISLSDFGEGIPVIIKKKEPALNDSEAILKACEKGFSTRSTPQNRGAGLPHLINHIVGHHNGTIAIHSNYGVVLFSQKAAPNGRITTSFYPGTLFDITLSTDNGFLRNLREDFEW